MFSSYLVCSARALPNECKSRVSPDSVKEKEIFQNSRHVFSVICGVFIRLFVKPDEAQGVWDDYV